MRKRKKYSNKGEVPLWREANYYIGCLFIVLYVAIQFLYQYKFTNQVFAEPLLSPVPDSHSDELATQLYFTYEPATEEKEEIKVEETITELTDYYGNKYQVDPAYLRCIIWFESRNNPLAIGDSGKAVGLCQFHLQTFLSFSKQAGFPQEDLRRDQAQSVKVLAWAISKNYDYHWSVVKRGLCK